MLLKGKVCVVIGAGGERGIGFATALLFAQHGAAILACDINMDEARATFLTARSQAEAERSGQIEFARCDITDRDDCASIFSLARELYGRVDCVVNCAGIVARKAIVDIAAADLDRMLEVNLKGAFNVCQSAMSFFSRQGGGGSIVNLASVAAQRGGGLVGGSHYAASKGGVISLTRSLAREGGPDGIRANVVCPALTDTAMLDGNITDETYEDIVASIPLRRAGRPLDVAGACLFLASDLSSYITGATIDVNGGSHIH